MTVTEVTFSNEAKLKDWATVQDDILHKVRQGDRNDVFGIPYGPQHVHTLKHPNPLKCLTVLNTTMGEVFVTHHGKGGANQINIWTLTPATEQVKLQKLEAHVNMQELLFIPRYRMFVAFCPDMTLRLFSDVLHNFHELFQARISRTVLCMVYNKATDEVVIGGQGFVQRWTLEVKEMKSQLHPGSRYEIHLSADEWVVSLKVDTKNKQLLILCDSGIYVVDYLTKEKKHYMKNRHGNSLTCSTFFSKRDYFITAAKDGSIKVWDMILFTQVVDFRGHYEPVTAVQIHPSEVLLISGSLDGTIRFWSLETFELFFRLDLQEPVYRMQLLNSEEMYYTTHHDIKVIKLNLFSHLFSIVQSRVEKLTRANWPGYPTRILASGMDGGVRILSPITGQLVTIIYPMNTTEVWTNYVYDRTTDHIFVVLNCGEVMIFDCSTNPCTASQVLEPHSHDEEILSIALIKTHRALGLKIDLTTDTLVFAGRKDGKIMLLNAGTHHMEKAVQGHSGKVILLESSIGAHGYNHLGSCDRLVSAGTDDKIRIWEVMLAKDKANTIKLYPLKSVNCSDIPSHMAMVGSLLFVAMTKESVLVTYGVASEEAVPKVLRHSVEDDHTATITALDVCPRLQIMATTGDDGMLKIWDYTNQLLQEVTFNPTLKGVCFANDWGDILIGLQNHVFSLPILNYLPGDYQEKLLLDNFGDDVIEEPIGFVNAKVSLDVHMVHVYPANLEDRRHVMADEVEAKIRTIETETKALARTTEATLRKTEDQTKEKIGDTETDLEDIAVSEGESAKLQAAKRERRKSFMKAPKKVVKPHTCVDGGKATDQETEKEPKKSQLIPTVEIESEKQTMGVEDEMRKQAKSATKPSVKPAKTLDGKPGKLDKMKPKVTRDATKMKKPDVTEDKDERDAKVKAIDEKEPDAESQGEGETEVKVEGQGEGDEPKQTTQDEEKKKSKYPVAPDGYIPNSVIRKLYNIKPPVIIFKDLWKLKKVPKGTAPLPSNLQESFEDLTAKKPLRWHDDGDRELIDLEARSRPSEEIEEPETILKKKKPAVPKQDKKVDFQLKSKKLPFPAKGHKMGLKGRQPGMDLAEEDEDEGSQMGEIHELLQRIASEPWYPKDRAITMEDILATLLKLLDDSGTPVKRVVMGYLGEFYSAFGLDADVKEDLISKLMKMLKCDDVILRVAAMKLLGVLGLARRDIILGLLPNLVHGDMRVRRGTAACIQQLTGVGDKGGLFRYLTDIGILSEGRGSTLSDEDEALGILSENLSKKRGEVDLDMSMFGRIHSMLDGWIVALEDHPVEDVHDELEAVGPDGQPLAGYTGSYDSLGPGEGRTGRGRYLGQEGHMRGYSPSSRWRLGGTHTPLGVPGDSLKAPRKSVFGALISAESYKREYLQPSRHSMTRGEDATSREGTPSKWPHGVTRDGVPTKWPGGRLADGTSKTDAVLNSNLAGQRREDGSYVDDVIRLRTQPGELSSARSRYGHQGALQEAMGRHGETYLTSQGPTEEIGHGARRRREEGQKGWKEDAGQYADMDSDFHSASYEYGSQILEDGSIMRRFGELGSGVISDDSGVYHSYQYSDTESMETEKYGHWMTDYRGKHLSPVTDEQEFGKAQDWRALYLDPLTKRKSLRTQKRRRQRLRKADDGGAVSRDNKGTFSKHYDTSPRIRYIQDGDPLYPGETGIRLLHSIDVKDGMTSQGGQQHRIDPIPGRHGASTIREERGTSNYGILKMRWTTETPFYDPYAIRKRPPSSYTIPAVSLPRIEGGSRRPTPMARPPTLNSQLTKLSLPHLAVNQPTVSYQWDDPLPPPPKPSRMNMAEDREQHEAYCQFYKKAKEERSSRKMDMALPPITTATSKVSTNDLSGQRSNQSLPGVTMAMLMAARI